LEPLGPAVVTELQTTWSLLPAVKINHDPSLREAVERSLHIEQITYSDQRSIARLSGTLSCRGEMPVTLAYRVFMIEGGRETPAGSVCFAPGFPHAAPLTVVNLMTGVARGRLPSTVDIELRPDPNVASPGVTTIWGGAVTLINVPLVVNEPLRYDPAGGKGGR
jgi:hypothetical protein